MGSKKLLQSELLCDTISCRKDTFGAFKKPVNPKELPDYHDNIEHPMDFKTIRQKLNNGEYANFEQFEGYVIALNYHGPELRIDNGDNESKMEQETSGRNNTIKRKAMAADSSANIGRNVRRLASLRPNMGWKGKDKLSAADAQRSASSDGTSEDESISADELGRETSEDDSGPRYGIVAISRRRSYEKDEHRSTNYELPMSAFDIGSRKQLVPVKCVKHGSETAASAEAVGLRAQPCPFRGEPWPRRLGRRGAEFGRGWVVAPEPATNAGATAAMAMQTRARDDGVSAEQRDDAGVDTINGFTAARLREFLRS
ncbi:uncharacterized protein LOC102704444 [Oryza brachyantha]|uniref:uncharacterized protein LOC102704444 n=1 Tax=Oryza brachyantha TaxID=4533 RepID=UPI0003EA9C25|nr:uncharacterized protein LOC102704444 [Oryza brachyantha]